MTCDNEECDLTAIGCNADVYRDELEFFDDTESDDIIQRKESKKKATKRLLLKRLIKKQAEKKNKQKSTESESDSDFEVGTFDKYNRVESKKKGKRPAVEKNSDSEDAVCVKKKRKGNKQEDNMMVAYKAEAEGKVIEVKLKINDRKTLHSRMSPKNLKRVLDSQTTAQQKRLKQMGFGEFDGIFYFYYVPCLEFIEPKKVNKKKKLKSITEDEDETPEKVEQKEDFHYKTFEEMKKILKDKLLKGRNLMEDTDNKLDIALAINSDDKELKLKCSRFL
ncbi:hypothetical protein Tco_0921578 [Tanacetum coccineum]